MIKTTIKGNRQGLKTYYWKMSEIKMIEENWETKTDREMAEMLSRPINTVRWMRTKNLGLKRNVQQTYFKLCLDK